MKAFSLNIVLVVVSVFFYIANSQKPTDDQIVRGLRWAGVCFGKTGADPGKVLELQYGDFSNVSRKTKVSNFKGFIAHMFDQ